MERNINRLKIIGFLIFAIALNSSAQTLTSPALPFTQPGHFNPVFAGKGVDHMNINLVSLPANLLQPGDEIGIFDGSLCVGAATVKSDHLARNSVSIPASAKDEYGSQGFTEGNQITIKLWKSLSGNEQVLEPDVIRGSTTFLKHESLFGSLEKYATGIFNQELFDDQPEIDCYPNPFNGWVNIRINLKEPASLAIDIFAADGRKIRQLAQKHRVGPGKLLFHWDGADSHGYAASAGIYYLRILTDNNTNYRKLISVLSD